MRSTGWFRKNKIVNNRIYCFKSNFSEQLGETHKFKMDGYASFKFVYRLLILFPELSVRFFTFQYLKTVIESHTLTLYCVKPEYNFLIKMCEIE